MFPSFNDFITNREAHLKALKWMEFKIEKLQSVTAQGESTETVTVKQKSPGEGQPCTDGMQATDCDDQR